MKLSVVIPRYNEEEILPLTLERLNKLSNEWIYRDDLTEIEFVFVDDGSQDRTYDLLTEISKADLRVKVVRFSRNFGHQADLLAGYESAQGDVIVSLFYRGDRVFKNKNKAETYAEKPPSQLAVNLGLDEFRGRRKIQLNIQDSRG